MSTNSKDQTLDFSLTLWQKILWGVLLLGLSVGVIFATSLVKGAAGTVLFVLLALLLGVVSFFIAGGWTFKLQLTGRVVVVEYRREASRIPLEKVGMLVMSGRFPYPTLWLVLRNCDQGREIPTRGVEQHTLELIEAYKRRNPGKTISIVPVPGGFVRSTRALALALKERIPPLVLDDRLGVK